MLHLLHYIYEENIYVNLGTWLHIGNLHINYGLILDSLAMTVIVPVGIVTLLVLYYAIDYMRYDINRNNFYIILSIFALFMTLLITSDNFIMMFIGWEFVGVISYLLISFWNTRIAAMKSALSAILLNRMGDTCYVIAISFMINIYSAVDYETLETLSPHIDTKIINIISLMLLLAATAKSAQLGLHSWLLQAMEGPTPVSALLHAATMVCAGIYVLVRSSFILEYSPSILLVIIWLGAITTLVSGLIAVWTNDIKRVIALSTMSQLSIMLIAVGSSAYDLAIYHLYCHAFFKALLFMSAGSIIHSILSETQDMRKYGGLIHYLPFTYITMFISSLSLMAIPGLSGYYSKDIIIETLYGSYNISGYIVYYIATASATLTAVYSTRVIYLTFFNTPNVNKYTYSTIHESIYMAIPMTILTIYSILLGYYRDNVIYHLIVGLPNTNNWIETEYTLPWYIKLLPLCGGLCMSFTLIYVYEFNYIINHSIYKRFYLALISFFNQKIYFDQILNNLIIRNVLHFGGNLTNYVDNGLLKTLGGTGIYRLLLNIPLLVLINLLWLLI